MPFGVCQFPDAAGLRREGCWLAVLEGPGDQSLRELGVSGPPGPAVSLVQPGYPTQVPMEGVSGCQSLAEHQEALCSVFKGSLAVCAAADSGEGIWVPCPRVGSKYWEQGVGLGQQQDVVLTGAGDLLQSVCSCSGVHPTPQRPDYNPGTRLGGGQGQQAPWTPAPGAARQQSPGAAPSAQLKPVFS